MSGLIGPLPKYLFPTALSAVTPRVVASPPLPGLSGPGLLFCYPPPSSQIDLIKRESHDTLPLLKAFQ